MLNEDRTSETNKRNSHVLRGPGFIEEFLMFSFSDADMIRTMFQYTLLSQYVLNYENNGPHANEYLSFLMRKKIIFKCPLPNTL